jgi:general secretion pathway protein K
MASRRAPDASRAPGPRTGSALLVVLVMLGMIAILASVVGRVVGGTARDLSAAVAGERAFVAARAGLEIAGLMLRSGELEALGTGVRAITLDDATVTIEVVNERGRIDLNGAPEELFAGLFRALGEEGEMADGLAARIVDWRDPDDDVREGGAEVGAYRGSGLAAPRNGPFIHPLELASVLNMPPALVQRALPYVTVGNPYGHVDPFVADALVLQALPGTSGSRIESFLEERQTGLGDSELAVLQLGASDEYVSQDPAPGWRATITVAPARGRPRRFVALIVDQEDDTRPYRVLYMFDEVLADDGP